MDIVRQLCELGHLYGARNKLKDYQWYTDETDLNDDYKKSRQILSNVLTKDVVFLLSRPDKENTGYFTCVKNIIDFIEGKTRDMQFNLIEPESDIKDIRLLFEEVNGLLRNGFVLLTIVLVPASKLPEYTAGLKEIKQEFQNLPDDEQIKAISKFYKEI